MRKHEDNQKSQYEGSQAGSSNRMDANYFNNDRVKTSYE